MQIKTLTLMKTRAGAPGNLPRPISGRDCMKILISYRTKDILVAHFHILRWF